MRAAGAALAVVLAAAGLTAVASPAYAAALPTITGFTPAVGTTAGGTVVTITGTGFSTVVAGTLSNIGIGGDVTAIKILSDTQIKGTVAAHAAGAVSVTVSNPTGMATAKTKFTFYAPLTAALGGATFLNPAGGGLLTVPISAGYTASATAAAFATEKITATIGGVAAAVSWISGANSVNLKVPATTVIDGAAKTIALFHAGVTGTNDATNAKYAAVISSITPAYGPLLGGTTVTLAGKGFSGAVPATFKVGLGTAGILATGCVIYTDIKATCVTPAAPKTFTLDTDPTITVGTSVVSASAGVAGAFTFSFTPDTGITFGATSGATFTYTAVQ